jgi:antitoxin CptB
VPDETPDIRLKRLYMRSIRRGIKEMDIILGRYADTRLAELDEASLDTYDGLLSENDQDLYQWVTGQAEPPAALAPLIEDIARLSNASGAK